MGTLKIQSMLNSIGSNKVSLDFFQKVSVLGSGGFSVVWKAKFKYLSHLVAIKQISKKKLMNSEKLLNLIITERNIMKDLYFPFISNLYCTFQDSLNIYFVFDYFCGGDLRYYLIKGIKFTENQIKFILGCLILSLEYIHSKKVIHRDIKPENLLFDDRGYVYLCDFGISIKENPNENNINKKIGTKRYIAPEGNYNYLSDFYSLGVVLYEIIFNDYYNINIQNEVIKEKIKGKNFSLDLYDFLAGLLEKNPNARLGHDEGIYDLKNHSFFKGFKFESLKKKEMISPFKPKYNHKEYIKLSSFKEINDYNNLNASNSNNDDPEFIENFDYICYNKIKKERNIINCYKANSSKFLTPVKVQNKSKNTSCDISDFSKNEKILFSTARNSRLYNKLTTKVLFKNNLMKSELKIKKEYNPFSNDLPMISQSNSNTNFIKNMNNKKNNIFNKKNTKKSTGINRSSFQIFRLAPRDKMKNV